MAKPGEKPSWIGTTVTPSSGKKTTGWLKDERPPYQFVNWFWKLVSDWIDWWDESAYGRTATHNQGDTPAPDLAGGGVIWAEIRTKLTDEIIIDNSMDWLDRFIKCWGFGKESASEYYPGGAIDEQINGYTGTSPLAGSNIIGDFLYTEQGGDGSANPRCSVRPHGYTQLAYIYAKANGDLAFKYAVAPTDEGNIILKIDYSPVQNHY